MWASPHTGSPSVGATWTDRRRSDRVASVRGPTDRRSRYGPGWRSKIRCGLRVGVPRARPVADRARGRAGDGLVARGHVVLGASADHVEHDDVADARPADVGGHGLPVPRDRDEPARGGALVRRTQDRDAAPRDRRAAAFEAQLARGHGREAVRARPALLAAGARDAGDALAELGRTERLRREHRVLVAGRRGRQPSGRDPQARGGEDRGGDGGDAAQRAGAPDAGDAFAPVDREVAAQPCLEQGGRGRERLSRPTDRREERRVRVDPRPGQRVPGQARRALGALGGCALAVEPAGAFQGVVGPVGHGIRGAPGGGSVAGGGRGVFPPRNGGRDGAFLRGSTGTRLESRGPPRAGSSVPSWKQRGGSEAIPGPGAGGS